MDYHLERIATHPERLLSYQSLFSTCFGSLGRFSPPALDWLYRQNPDGMVVGFDAFAGNELAAHYACIPARVRLFGENVLVLLSLNTATHPDHQGKGLFTRLARATYELAREQGFAAIYGIANANSTPGFVGKLGFQLVSPLLATVGLGAWRTDLPRAEAQAQFMRLWSVAALEWRCANPINKIHQKSRSGVGSIYVAAGPSRFIDVGAELSIQPKLQGDSKRGASLIRLHLGLVPPGNSPISGHVNIPDRLRPSPLNLIYLDLRDGQRKLAPDSILFTFLDFDAY